MLSFAVFILSISVRKEASSLLNVDKVVFIGTIYISW